MNNYLRILLIVCVSAVLYYFLTKFLKLYETETFVGAALNDIQEIPKDVKDALDQSIESPLNVDSVISNNDINLNYSDDDNIYNINTHKIQKLEEQAPVPAEEGLLSSSLQLNPLEVDDMIKDTGIGGEGNEMPMDQEMPMLMDQEMPMPMEQDMTTTN